jgi:hypothetical protein
MPGRDERSHRARFEANLLLLLALVGIHPFPARGQAPLRLVGQEGTALERALTEAAREAERKLATPACQLVFSDFRSLDGHWLAEVLRERGQDAATYFRGLVYYDGYGRESCATREILATTSPGSRAVYLCSSQFVEKARRDPGLAAALLIHEELHALGLGENPPSSKEITQRVIQRCGK